MDKINLEMAHDHFLMEQKQEYNKKRSTTIKNLGFQCQQPIQLSPCYLKTALQSKGKSNRNKKAVSVNLKCKTVTSQVSAEVLAFLRFKIWTTSQSNQHYHLKDLIFHQLTTHHVTYLQLLQLLNDKIKNCRLCLVLNQQHFKSTTIT